MTDEQLTQEAIKSVSMIKKATVGKDDIVVVKVDIGKMPANRAQQYMDSIGKMMKQSLKDSNMSNRVLIIPKSMDIEIMAKEKVKAFLAVDDDA